MARKPHEEPSGDAWMNTYSDLVTLLMTFFVLLFSMSSVNAEKWEMLVSALSDPDKETSQIVVLPPDAEQGDNPAPSENDHESQGGLNPMDPESTIPESFDDLFEFLQRYVEEQGLSDSIEVMKNGDSVVYIRFRNSIFFEPDKAVLRAEAYEILGYLGDCLYAVQDDIYVISINGHTADVGDEDYSVSDWQLSGNRAGAVADYFDAQKDIEATKLRPMGYGRTFPIADNSTVEGRQQNRRVDMTIVRNATDAAGESRVEQELASLFDPNQFPKSGGATDLLGGDTGDGAAGDAAAGDAAASGADTAPVGEPDAGTTGGADAPTQDAQDVEDVVAAIEGGEGAASGAE